jgi:DNA-directed RNA polymerase specialized sigma subunit
VEESHYRYLELRDRLTSIPAQIMRDMPRTQSAFDKITDSLARLEEIQDSTTKLIDEYIKIENAIYSIPDSVERRLMKLRYIDGLTFEEISVVFRYSWRHIHRLHSKALNNINMG